MSAQLPLWLDLLFIATALTTLVFFYLANGKPKLLISIIVVIAIVQSLLAYNSVYQDTTAMPPRFIYVLLFPIVLIIYGLRAKQILWMKSTRNLKLSTMMHVIRVPVELCLFFLFTYKMIPELMTFEGRNYDIISGITAPIAWLLYRKNIISEKGLIVWNVICLGLVVFIAINGILSAELPFQKFAFDQPNKALLYFPYVLLPAMIVPIVIYTHLSDIIYLKHRNREKEPSSSS